MYYFYVNYDVIDEFISIYNVLEMALSSMLYIINDIIMCSYIIQCQVSFFSYNLRYKWRLSVVEDRWSYYI